MLLGNFISHHKPFVKKRSYYSFRYGERLLIMTSPSSFLHPVLMLRKNVLAPVEIVLLVTDPINFINMIFTVLFQSWASFVQSVRNIHYNEAYISPTLNIHHQVLWNTASDPFVLLCNSQPKCSMINADSEGSGFMQPNSYLIKT